ncbi:MAG: hypothetical protein ACOY0S_02210 [Patescibacteria group bacterium]
MNRDAILATLIGFGIGLVITGILVLSPNLTKKLGPLSLPKITFSLPQLKPKSSPTPTPTPPPALTLDSPLPEAVENKAELLVSGKTSSGAIVVIQGPQDEDVTLVKEDGKYAGKVTLLEGKNEIMVTGYISGKPLKQTVTVFYTPEEF